MKFDCFKFFLFLWGFPVLLSAQAPLSAQSEISILTLGPHQAELYSAFWHSAIRVKDPVAQIDKIYNYGIFDFDNPNFYTDFAKGHLLYRLGDAPFDRFFAYYSYVNRSVEEQILNLTLPQKQAMFEYLETNNLPENRYYNYDYLFDNCATRIRDVVVAILGENVRFDGSYLTRESTFRELISECTEYQPWGDFGIDLGLGSQIDRIASPYEHMFLPYYVRDAFANGVILTGTEVKPLVRENRLLFEPKPDRITKTFLTPQLVFWSLLALVILWTILPFSSITSWPDVVLFWATGLFGLAIALIWLATDHRLAADNYNLLWLNPLNLVFGVLLLGNPASKIVRYYSLANGIVLTLLLVIWQWLPQELHPAALPLILALGLRSLWWYRRSR